MQMQPQKQGHKIDDELTDIQHSLGNLIIGQASVLDQIVNSFSRIMAGLTDKERSLLSLLLLGPTGVGKTETVRVLSEIIFGDRRAFTRINCQEYSAHYNISKMLGSPPGYVGSEIKSLLSQENLERHFHVARANHRGLISDDHSSLSRIFPIEGDQALSILLFDEIEKAHPKVWNILLSIIEDGSITLGNNEEVDFTNTIIICTSNVGGKIVYDHLSGRSIGFDIGQNIRQLREEVNQRVLNEARQVFPAELLNRMDEIITFNVLDRQDLLQILEILICRVRGRVYACHAPFLLEFTEAARNGLVAKIAAYKEYGARPLKRVLEQQVMNPISRHICSGEIVAGDLVTVDVEGELEFFFQITDGLNKESPNGLIMPSSTRTSVSPLDSRYRGGKENRIPKIKREEE